MHVFLFLAIGAIALFSFLAVAVWSGERRREREAYYRSETMRKLTDTLGSGNTTAIEYLREEDKILARRRREGQKLGGLITAVVGIAVIVFLRAITRSEEEPIYLVGIIPLFIGVALLAYAYLLAPRE